MGRLKLISVVVLVVFTFAILTFSFLCSPANLSVQTQKTTAYAETKLEPEDNGVERPSKGVSYFSNLGELEYLLKDDVEEKAHTEPIIFNSHVTYSPFFATTYGFPEKFVSSELPSYVDYLAIDIKLAGNFRRCSIKMLIDKDGPIALPETNLYLPFAGTNLNMMRGALPSRNGDFSEQPYQQQYRITHSEYDSSQQLRKAVHSSFALVGLEDIEKPIGKGASVSLVIDSYKNNQFKEWSFIELSPICHQFSKKIFDSKFVFVTARALKGDQLVLDKENFENAISIKIPRELAKKVRTDFSRLSTWR